MAGNLAKVTRMRAMERNTRSTIWAWRRGVNAGSAMARLRRATRRRRGIPRSSRRVYRRANANASWRGAHCKVFNARLATQYSSTLRKCDLRRMNLNCTPGGGERGLGAGSDVCETKVDADAIHRQNGLNLSVCVRKAGGAVVGQLGRGTLWVGPIVNRPDPEGTPRIFTGQRR